MRRIFRSLISRLSYGHPELPLCSHPAGCWYVRRKAARDNSMVSPRAPGERWRARRGLAANRRKRLLLGRFVVYLHRCGVHLANALTALLQVGPCRLIDVGLLVI